jgi:hypothetical protein
MARSFQFVPSAGFRDCQEQCGIYGRPIHTRGCFYAFLGLRKPDGSPFDNTLRNWDRVEKASNAARWLNYVEWEMITDKRNTAPV